MKYQEALKEWGARHLEEFHRRVSIDRNTVTVGIDLDPGYFCCGEYLDGPSANVEITGLDAKGKTYLRQISHWDFDFAAILGEIIKVGGGSINEGTTGNIQGS